MVKTTIEIETETRTKLAKTKYTLNCRSYDEVINKLFKLITKYKLAKDLESLK